LRHGDQGIARLIFFKFKEVYYERQIVYDPAFAAYFPYKKKAGAFSLIPFKQAFRLLKGK